MKRLTFVLAVLIMVGVVFPYHIQAQEGDDNKTLFHPDERIHFTTEGEDIIRLNWSGEAGTCKLVPLFEDDELFPANAKALFPTAEIRAKRGWGEKNCLDLNLEIKPSEWRGSTHFGKRVVRVLLLRRTEGGWESPDTEVIDVSSPIISPTHYGQVTGDTELLTRPGGSEIAEIAKGELVKVSGKSEGFFHVSIIIDGKVETGYLPEKDLDLALWGSSTFFLFEEGYWIAIPLTVVRSESTGISDDYQHFMTLEPWVPLEKDFTVFFNNKARLKLDYRVNAEEHTIWLPADWVLIHSGFPPIWEDAYAWRLEGSLNLN